MMKRNRMTTTMKTLFRDDIAKLCLKNGITTKKLAERLPKRWHNHYANREVLMSAILYHVRQSERMTLSGNGKKLIHLVEIYDGPDEIISEYKKRELIEAEVLEPVEEKSMHIDRDFCVAEIESLAKLEREALAEMERLKVFARTCMAKRMAMKEFLGATDKLIDLGAFQID